MKLYQLRSVKAAALLFEGHFEDFRACLERAVADRVTLNRVNLRYRNLTNASLDAAIMAHADFTGANLTGANLSESGLRGANFNGASLYNACFHDSDMTDGNFTNAAFGATDICGAVISHSRFSTLSCFHLDFVQARQMDGCVFVNRDGQICEMSAPPVVIQGLGRETIILLDRHIKSGHDMIDRKRLGPLTQKLATRIRRQRPAA